MGKIVDFSLTLNRAVNTYKNGDVISGSLNVKISKRLKIKRITIKIIGEGQTYWY